MPTLTQVRNAIDTRLATIWNNQVQPRQDAYFVAHGRYWQGLVTTLQINLPNNPSDGNNIILEMVPNLLGHPTDQSETWADNLIVLEATIPMAVEMWAYGGPLGQGYVGIVYGKWNGNVYKRSQNFGPESWRTEGWALIS